MSKNKGQKKSVTMQTYKTIENNLKNFILARFMIYKWVNPFSEMYIKYQQQHKKLESNELVLFELFDDLFGETYRADSPLKKKKVG